MYIVLPPLKRNIPYNSYFWAQKEVYLDVQYLGVRMARLMTHTTLQMFIHWIYLIGKS